MKYRKKTTVLIEAIRMPVSFQVGTLEGVMSGDAGDWLITGINGEQYPCKHEIFMKTYEPVEE